MEKIPIYIARDVEKLKSLWAHTANSENLRLNTEFHEAIDRIEAQLEALTLLRNEKR